MFRAEEQPEGRTLRGRSGGAGAARVALIPLVVAVVLVACSSSTVNPTPGRSPSPPASPVAPGATVAIGGPTEIPGSGGPVGTVPVESNVPGTPAPAGEVAMPVVPVVGFWSTVTDISTQQLTAALEGRDSTWTKVIVPAADRDAIGTALGIQVAGSVGTGSAAATRAAVKGGALGFMRASDVTPAVRALSIDGKALFGEQRVKNAGEWPLSISLPASAAGAWDQSKSWTLLAGGDMFLDRGVYREVVLAGKGVDYPFDGGTAIVTGHHTGTGYVKGYPVPDVQLTGNAGAVRALTQGADLSIANLETPVPDNWVYHAHNYVFNGDPSLLPMFTNAGFDWVTIANNHILDAGASGIADSRKNLAAAGLGFGGAGKNITQAGQISNLQARGTRVAIIACDAVGALAGANSAGGLPCNDRYVVPRIQEARQSADVVIVFPHWGIDATVQHVSDPRSPTSSQRSLAADWLAAGADLILGSHSHFAGAIDDIDGHVVLYSLGNFIFDQDYWTDTSESFLPEMTFEGNRLVQLTLHPFVMRDQAQPNLLNPATDDGAALLKAVRNASTGLGW